LVDFLPVYKVAGAAAEQGASLDACLEIGLRMERNMRTLAVAVRTATHPSTGQPIFELGDDEMEIGMGQHGEAGTGRAWSQGHACAFHRDGAIGHQHHVRHAEKEPGVHHSGQREKTPCVYLSLGRRCSGFDERADPPVTDEDVAGVRAIGDDHRSTYCEVGHRHAGHEA